MYYGGYNQLGSTGGYSVQTYEPNDLRPEELSQNNHFLNMINSPSMLTPTLMPQNIITQNYISNSYASPNIMTQNYPIVQQNYINPSTPIYNVPYSKRALAVHRSSSTPHYLGITHSRPHNIISYRAPITSINVYPVRSSRTLINPVPQLRPITTIRSSRFISTLPQSNIILTNNLGTYPTFRKAYYKRAL